MNRFIIILLLTFCGHFANAQRKENRNFFKLFVLNDKQEVLLIKFQGEWEIPGASYNLNVPISAFLDTIAMQHGISIKNKKFSAQITFHHETRENPTIMLYYLARYSSGNLVVPTWGEEVKWMDLNEAYKLIPYPEMVKIMKQIDLKGNTVWGGAVKITYDKTTQKRMGYEVIEDFYKLN